MPVRTCQWCRSKHSGQFYELVPGEWYCVACSANRLYKAGKLPSFIVDRPVDMQIVAIEDFLFSEVPESEINSAVKELQEWINDSEA